MSDDPTRIRNQPALTVSSGRIWLIVGGLFTAIALAVLIPMTGLAPRGLALAAVIAIAILYLAMIVARLTAPAGRRRLGIMAVLMLAIAAVALGVTLAVAFAAA